MIRKRITYSQNFLKNKKLILDLLAKSFINRNDIVYEIGAGQGIITEALLKRSKKVVTFEIDKNLYIKLKNQFSNYSNIELHLGDFLQNYLPNYDYKVFSNIPFKLTADIIKKLTEAKNPPADCYLITQKEAAKKYIGKPYSNRNSQASILLKPWFELNVIFNFKKTDFYPKPSIDTVLLRIKKRGKTFVGSDRKSIYRDFIIYSFSQWKPTLQESLKKVFTKHQFAKLAKDLRFSLSAKPSDLDFKQWLGLFNFFLVGVDSCKQKVIHGATERLFKQQKKLRKIHRTRTDKNWKSSFTK